MGLALNVKLYLTRITVIYIVKSPVCESHGVQKTSLRIFQSVATQYHQTWPHS
jgi:hypothetical protein